MVAGPGSCVETGRRSPPTQQIPDVFSVGSARDESRRGCTDGKTELLTSVDTSRRIASRSTSSANAPSSGMCLFASPTFNSVRHSRWGWAARLRADPMFAVVFMGCLEVVDNAVRRPRDAALTRMRAKVSTCSLTVRKLAALFGVPAQGRSPAERDVAHGCPPGERVWVRLRISTFGCRFRMCLTSACWRPAAR